MVDFVAILSRETNKDELNAQFRKYASGAMKGFLSCTDEELVSRDFYGNPHSSIVDLPSTAVIGGRMVKIISWYDNDGASPSRMVRSSHSCEIELKKADKKNEVLDQIEMKGKRFFCAWILSFR
jgi:glyceraldehyde 3-phosphate dehydrogenase